MVTAYLPKECESCYEDYGCDFAPCWPCSCIDFNVGQIAHDGVAVGDIEGRGRTAECPARHKGDDKFSTVILVKYCRSNEVSDLGETPIMTRRSSQRRRSPWAVACWRNVMQLSLHLFRISVIAYSG